jgi:hypothetical protein
MYTGRQIMTEALIMPEAGDVIPTVTGQLTLAARLVHHAGRSHWSSRWPLALQLTLPLVLRFTLAL